MKYTILTNGYIVNNMTITKGDILIGNNRIIDMGKKLRLPTPDTQIIDAYNKYLLPGLLHLRCPFLKDDDETSHSAIYIAISQGATFLIDILKLKSTNYDNEYIEKVKLNCQPIVADYGLHLDAACCSDYGIEELSECFLHEGISSFHLRWKYVDKLLSGELDHILRKASKLDFLLILETASVKANIQMLRENAFRKYLDRLQEIITYVKKAGVKMLITDISSMDEVDELYAFKDNDHVYAAITPGKTASHFHQRITTHDILELHSNPNIILNSPALSLPENTADYFIENGKNPSFIMEMIGQTNKPAQYLPKLCDMFATRPAQLLGVYPQKGTLNPGADADIIVWNPTVPDQIKTDGANTSLLRQDISTLILNGEVISEEQLIISHQLRGRYIHRFPILTARHEVI
ncbi:amidohydrolase family protein [Alkaliflexus imshenetskii]|uniref:amidohydrolase family protein n=1 Tax=Alkaliflexus imshenetskii TaxID=286730 RepID=UPI00047C5363|nr:amidohydrolase family protein [Alkaliflexus imshenetskii]